MPHTTEEELEQLLTVTFGQLYIANKDVNVGMLVKAAIPVIRSTILSCEPENWKLKNSTVSAGGKLYKAPKTPSHPIEYWNGYNAALAAYTANIVKVLGGKDE